MKDKIRMDLDAILDKAPGHSRITSCAIYLLRNCMVKVLSLKTSNNVLFLKRKGICTKEAHNKQNSVTELMEAIKATQTISHITSRRLKALI